MRSETAQMAWLYSRALRARSTTWASRDSRLCHAARQEWTRLTWLCALCGLDEIALPDETDVIDRLMATRLASLTRFCFVIDEDPVGMMTEQVQNADVVMNDEVDAVVQKAIEIAIESEWFGHPLTELESIPDRSFIYRDDLTIVDTFMFLSQPGYDMFAPE